MTKKRLMGETLDKAFLICIFVDPTITLIKFKIKKIMKNKNIKYYNNM